jgi:hypothetical protein
MPAVRVADATPRVRRGHRLLANSRLCIRRSGLGGMPRLSTIRSRAVTDPPLLRTGGGPKREPRPRIRFGDYIAAAARGCSRLVLTDTQDGDDRRHRGR